MASENSKKPTSGKIEKPKKKVWLRVFLILILVFILLILATGSYIGYNYFLKKPVPVRTSVPLNYTQRVWEYGYVNYSDVAEEMQDSDFVKDLPPRARVVLEIYNYTEGQYFTEKIYLIENNQIREVSSMPENDLWFAMSSKYLVNFQKEEFCYVVQSSRKNEELLSGSNLSDAQLLWKFKGMLKYRDCLGF